MDYGNTKITLHALKVSSRVFRMFKLDIIRKKKKMKKEEEDEDAYALSA